MKKFELIPASRATRNGTNITSSSGDENVPCLEAGSLTSERRTAFVTIVFLTNARSLRKIEPMSNVRRSALEAARRSFGKRSLND